MVSCSQDRELVYNHTVALMITGYTKLAKDSYHPGLDEVPMAFKDEIIQALEAHPDARRKLAQYFEVAESTIDRMAAGTANPHPRAQKYILDFINNKLDCNCGICSWCKNKPS